MISVWRFRVFFVSFDESYVGLVNKVRNFNFEFIFNCFILFWWIGNIRNVFNYGI